MSQEIIYTKTESHFDKSDWPVNPGDGVDSHWFTVPAGLRFARYSIDVEVASLGSNHNVESAPESGATGEQLIRVRWWYNPYGKVRYTINVYAGDPEAVTICHGENNWAGKALDAIQQGQDFTISGKGLMARRLFLRINRISGKAMAYDFSSLAKPPPVSVTMSVPLGLIATVKYGAIGGIMLFALERGYRIEAAFDAHGPLPFDDELTFEMIREG